MGGGKRVQVARFGAHAAQLVAAANAVVVVVMGTRDELRRTGAAAGKLEKRHFVGRRWSGNEIIARPLNGCRQAPFAAVVEQQSHAYRRMLADKIIQKFVIGKQRVFAIGNQQGGFNLGGVGVELATLMAEQRIHRRHADPQQREKRQIKFRDVAQLHQRRFAALQALTLQRGGEIINQAVELTITVAFVAVDNGGSIVFGMTGNQVSQRQILPVTFLPIAGRERFRPAGKFDHHSPLLQAEYVQHGGQFNAGFAPLA